MLSTVSLSGRKKLFLRGTGGDTTAADTEAGGAPHPGPVPETRPLEDVLRSGHEF